MSNFVTARDLRNKTSMVWDELRAEGELVVTSNGRPVAILCSLEEGIDLETVLTDIRRAKAVRAVDEIQQRASTMGLNTMTEEEIEEEIKEVRNQRLGQ